MEQTIGADDWTTVKSTDLKGTTIKKHTIRKLFLPYEPYPKANTPVNKANLFTVKSQAYNLGTHSLDTRRLIYTFRGALYPKYSAGPPSSRSCISTDCYRYAYGLLDAIQKITCKLQLQAYGVYLPYLHGHYASEPCLVGRKLGTYRATPGLRRYSLRGWASALVLTRSECSTSR